jgi:LuxR family maltose regulon positive regulatory protein
MARPEGYVRIFVDEGEPMVVLLRDAFLRGIAPQYVRELLEAAGVPLDQSAPATPLLPANLAQIDGPLIETLSRRELEVLRFLATTLSSTEIAEHLSVSVNTVRSHIRHIYGKLDVHSRFEAISRAQELQLL